MNSGLLLGTYHLSLITYDFRFPHKNLFIIFNFKPVALQISKRCLKHGEGFAAGDLATEFGGTIQTRLYKRILSPFTPVLFSRPRPAEVGETIVCPPYCDDPIRPLQSEPGTNQRCPKFNIRNL